MEQTLRAIQSILRIQRLWIATNIYNYWNNGGIDMDSGFLINKSYVKLRSVVLQLGFAKQLVEKYIPYRCTSLVLLKQSLCLDKNNTFIDPEVTSFGNDLEGNFGEYSANPSSRKVRL